MLKTGGVSRLTGSSRDRRRKNLRVARECVLLARLADSVELRDEPIQLLRMVTVSSFVPSSVKNLKAIEWAG
jgi:hypothetical protein